MFMSLPLWSTFSRRLTIGLVLVVIVLASVSGSMFEPPYLQIYRNGTHTLIRQINSTVPVDDMDVNYFLDHIFAYLLSNAIRSYNPLHIQVAVATHSELVEKLFIEGYALKGAALADNAEIISDCESILRFATDFQKLVEGIESNAKLLKEQEEMKEVYEELVSRVVVWKQLMAYVADRISRSTVLPECCAVDHALLPCSKTVSPIQAKTVVGGKGQSHTII